MVRRESVNPDPWARLARAEVTFGTGMSPAQVKEVLAVLWEEKAKRLRQLRESEGTP